MNVHKLDLSVFVAGPGNPFLTIVSKVQLDFDLAIRVKQKGPSFQQVIELKSFILHRFGQHISSANHVDNHKKKG